MSKPRVPGAGYPPPSPPKGAALYEASIPVFVNGRLYQPGEQFRTDEKPGRTWRVIEKAKPESGGGRGSAKAPSAEEKPAGDQSPI